MLSTSALTWAAAQEHVPVYELIRGLSTTDERRIEAAYSEWRRRAAAGERRHKVDWRNYSLSDDEVVVETEEAKPTAEEPVAVEPEKAKPTAEEPVAKDVASVPVPAEPVPADPVSTVKAKPVPTVEGKPVPDEPIPAVETNETEEPIPAVEAKPVLADPVPAVEAKPVLADPVPAMETSEAEKPIPGVNTSEEEPVHTMETSEADEEADQAAIEALTEILEEEQLDGEYISLDDFNFEPSEAEMQALEEAIKADELLTEDVSEDGEDAADGGEAEAAADEATDAGETITEARKADVTELVAAVDETVKLRISKLGKDVSTSVYEDLLVSLAINIEVAKAVTEAVIKDHTKRHKGTAPQRAFLAWLENR